MTLGRLNRIMEGNTLPPKPRKVMNGVWLFVLVSALLIAVGRAIFG